MTTGISERLSIHSSPPSTTFNSCFTNEKTEVSPLSVQMPSCSNQPTNKLEETLHCDEASLTELERLSPHGRSEVSQISDQSTDSEQYSDSEPS